MPWYDTSTPGPFIWHETASQMRTTFMLPAQAFIARFDELAGHPEMAGYLDRVSQRTRVRLL